MVRTAVATMTFVLAAACGGTDGEPSPRIAASRPDASLSGPTDVRGTADVSAAGGTPAVTVALADSAFVPTFVRTAPGARVTVSLRNTGALPHTFTVDGGPDRRLEPGATAQVEVTTAGPLTVFYCRFHRAGGMQGAFHTGAAPAGATATAEPDRY